MQSGEPIKRWKNIGIEKVVLLEPKDMKAPNVRRIETFGYEIGAVANQGAGQIIVLQLPGSNQTQMAFSVLELDDVLHSLSQKWSNVR